MIVWKEEQADVYSKSNMTVAVFKRRNESQRKRLSLWGRRSAMNGLQKMMFQTPNLKLEDRSEDPMWPEVARGSARYLTV